MKKVSLLLFFMITVLVCSACFDQNNTPEISLPPYNAEHQSEDSEDLSEGSDEEAEEVEEDIESATDENNSIDTQLEEPIIDENIDPEVVDVILTHLEAVNERDKDTVLDTLDGSQETDWHENEWQLVLWDYAVENDENFYLASMQYYTSTWENQVIISFTLQEELNGAVALWKRDDGWKIDNFDVNLSNFNRKKEWLIQ